jgi:hypothetical protein
MRERSRATVSELRTTIACLPRATRIAMLEGIRSNDIIVGAYTHEDGICPMLAAHRAGGRTNFISFAKAWDRFAFRSAVPGKARRATERELLILRTHLEASLIEDEAPAAELREAIADHRELVARTESRASKRRTEARASRRVRPGDRDRSGELRTRPGWSWMRVVRRYDDYQRVLARLEQDQATASEQQQATSREPAHA